MLVMAMTLRLPDAEQAALARYAAEHNQSMHEAARHAIRELTADRRSKFLALATTIIAEDHELLVRLRDQ